MVDKTPRASSSRATDSRRKPWTPPSSLDAPPPPEGYIHRWIRESVMGYDDRKNISGRIREGFELVRSDDDLMREEHPSMPITTDRQSRVTFGGRRPSADPET